MKTTVFSHLLIGIFLWILNVGTVVAWDPDTEVLVKGQVVDSLTSEPVSFATLRVTPVAHGVEPVALLACDMDGYFSATLPGAGSYYFDISSIGKVSARKKLTVPNTSSTWNAGCLSLVEDAKVIGEVTVSAQKPLVKVDIDKLVYSMSEDPEAKVNNTLEMLRKVPLVTVDGEDNILLKGSGNFKIYMNGRPSGLLGTEPAAVLKSIPASSVKDIEVITDPGSRYDAEGVSGIINIITQRRTLDGYTGTLTAEASVNQTYGGGAFVSLKAGKLGLTANYNMQYVLEPTSDMTSFRENFTDDASRYLSQVGTHWERERVHRGYLEGTFEIDSLNLITVDANMYRKRQTDYSDLNVDLMSANRDLVYSYDRLTVNKPVYGSIELNANYQHETQRKGEILTFSYRFFNLPRDNETRTTITGILNYDDLLLWDTNAAHTDEHTFQLDYVRPIIGGNELEMGVKYILRLTDSEITQHLYDKPTDSWSEPEEGFVDFKHTQHIYSAYLGDAFRWGELGIKAGVRAEGTSLSVNYANDPAQNFKSSFVDVVPNVSLSYSIGQSQQLRLGYNMRIQRAGIKHLNPYVDKRDPLNIEHGNPNLGSERSNSVNLNYTLFTQKFNMNASLSHTFVNNSIEQYTQLDPERPQVSISTYGNIGKRHQTGLYLYTNWSPSPMFRFIMNSGMDYIRLRSTENNLANSGWNGHFLVGAQFSFPKDFRLGMQAMYMLPRIRLQGGSSDYLTHWFNIQKDFLHKKLTVSLYCRNPFTRTWADEDRIDNPTFSLSDTEYTVMRDFSISVSYRFGSLKDTFKKIKRTIVNDDMK
ncbi:TonB-dependent receptor domain-containing protein [Parabacteroides sp.]